MLSDQDEIEPEYFFPVQLRYSLNNLRDASLHILVHFINITMLMKVFPFTQNNLTLMHRINLHRSANGR